MAFGSAFGFSFIFSILMSLVLSIAIIRYQRIQQKQYNEQDKNSHSSIIPVIFTFIALFIIIGLAIGIVGFIIVFNFGPPGLFVLAMLILALAIYMFYLSSKMKREV